MGSKDESSLDISYLVAALIEENGGKLTVSESWFTLEENPFAGAHLKLTNENGLITIELEEI